MKTFTLAAIFLFGAFLVKAQVPKMDISIGGKSVSNKSIKSKAKPPVIKIKDIIENRILELSDKTYVIEKYTFFITVNGKLVELKETGNSITQDIVDELKELDSAKDRKFNAYIDDVVALHDDKQVKVNGAKFIIEK